MTLSKFTSLVVVGLLTMYAHPAMAQSGSDGQQQSTLDGVYTVEQARRGEKIVAETCGACHMQDWFVETLMQSWAGASVGMLYELIATTMPQDSPGGLPAGQAHRFPALPSSRISLPSASAEFPNSTR